MTCFWPNHQCFIGKRSLLYTQSLSYYVGALQRILGSGVKSKYCNVVVLFERARLCVRPISQYLLPPLKFVVVIVCCRELKCIIYHFII